MQWGQWDQFRQCAQNITIHADWGIVFNAAMDYAVPDTDNLHSINELHSRGEYFARGQIVIQTISGPGAVRDRAASCVFDLEVWPDPESIYLTSKQNIRLTCSLTNRELDAGGSGIDHCDASWHGSITSLAVGADSRQAKPSRPDMCSLLSAQSSGVPHYTAAGPPFV
jgi:hypothetical protein